MTAAIWSYWEGPRSPIIDLCLQTLALHNPTFRCVGPERLADMGGGEVLEATEGMPKPYRSDLARLWLLRQQGGLWVDADTICTHPLSIVEEAAACDLWGVFHPRRNPRGLLATPFGCRPGSPVVADGYDRCLAALDKYRRTRRLRYGATSVGLLTELFQAHRRRGRVARREHWRWAPVHWQRARTTFNRVDSHAGHAHARAWNPNAELWHIFNTVAHDQAAVDLKRSLTFAAFVLRKALRIRPAVTGRALEAVDRLAGVAAPRVVEIGTNQGENAESLLFLRRDLVLRCVDPWAAPTARYAASEPQQARVDWRQRFRQVERRLAPFGERVVLDRRRSVEAAPDVADRSLDLAFIDAEHTRAAVAEDLQAWAPKVRPGGWIGGHDYGHPKFPGVREAVDAWASVRGATIQRGRDSTWWVRLR